LSFPAGIRPDATDETLSPRGRGRRSRGCRSARAEIDDGNSLYRYCNAMIGAFAMYCFGYVEWIVNDMHIFGSVDGFRACLPAVFPAVFPAVSRRFSTTTTGATSSSPSLSGTRASAARGDRADRPRLRRRLSLPDRAVALSRFPIGKGPGATLYSFQVAIL